MGETVTERFLGQLGGAVPGSAVPFLASATVTAATSNAVDEYRAQIAKIAGRGDAGRGPGFRGRRAHELWFEKAPRPQQEGLNISAPSPSEEVAATRRNTGSDQARRVPPPKTARPCLRHRGRTSEKGLNKAASTKRPKQSSPNKAAQTKQPKQSSPNKATYRPNSRKTPNHCCDQNPRP